MNINKLKNNWEKLKQKQSNYLKKLYPDWLGIYDGSEPAELAEFMNLSYAEGEKQSIEKAYQSGKDEANKENKKECIKFIKQQIVCAKISKELVYISEMEQSLKWIIDDRSPSKID